MSEKPTYEELEQRIQEFEQAEFERKQTVKELQKSRERYRRIFENLQDVYYEVDVDGTILEVSPSIEIISQYTRKALIGKSLYDIYTDPKERYEFLKIVLDKGRINDYEINLKDIDGSQRLCSIIALLIRDSQGIPIRIIGSMRDISKRKRAEKALKESEDLFRLTFHTSPDSINLNRLEDGVYIDINDGFTTIMGYTREEVVGKSSLSLNIWENPEDRKRLVDNLTKTGYVENMEATFVGKDGKIIYGLMSARITKVNGENIIISINRDITERKLAEAEREKLQAQLGQAQKMESVGRLAGGIAHDFNNMLGIILGHTDMALEYLDSGQPVHSDLQAIRRATKRSEDLVRQLLAFARKQTIAPKVLVLNDTVEGMLKMLRRLIGENIHLSWMPGKNLWPVNMDPTQIDQILANLCVNARDAIDGVGRVAIETDNVTLDEGDCTRYPEAVPGDYVLLAVSDDGCGIDKEILDKLFEPFFTTKEVGKGTGLGLPMIYGIVKQNNGIVNVYSEPGEGTTFKIYIPRHIGEDKREQKQSAGLSLVGGHETVLLVEDEPILLQMGKAMLERLGYRVLDANSPAEAVKIAEEHKNDIHLLITDVIMPEMNGRDLADKLLSLLPHLKLLFMSGYTADVIAHHGVLDPGVKFVQKPFSMKDLANRIREALES
jgi:two-component system, cell cycle sensor histidine kinase and response regulator CckA